METTTLFTYNPSSPMICDCHAITITLAFDYLRLMFSLFDDITILMESMYQKIDKPQASTCAKVIRGFNVVSGVLLIAFGIVGLIHMILNDVISARFFLVFSPVFIIIFGMVMIAVQFKVGLVMQTFDFLGTLMGKGIFYIYLSSVVFFFFSCGTDETTLAWIISMIVFGLGVVYVLLNCCSGDYNNEVKEGLI